jgi:RHS repeat-associated protein
VDQQDYGNGVRSKYEYDGRGMISSLRHKKSANGPDLTYREYWRDERDRIMAWKRGTESSQNGMEDGRGDRYYYDEEGQLTAASYRTHDPAGSAGDPMRNDIFSYDALGNRVRSNYLASRGWLDFTRKDNGLNQYGGWWNYSVTNYDADLGGVWGSPGHANGVLMQEGWITGSYNALNQPVSMWSPAFAGTSNWMWFGHDPLGRCVKRWIGPSGTSANNPTYFYYDGWSLIQEGGSASNATRVYVQGGRVDEIVAQITPGNGWQRYFQYDARGHCILQTDALGDIVEQYDYDAFGFPYFYDRWGNNMPSSPWGNRFLFTGREWLSELRTYDYRNRMFQPELGRFLQPDPMQFKAGDYNLYRYCHNDPVNHFDPFGLLTWRYEKGFPEKGPGGSKAIERAIKNELRKSKKGREILDAEGVVTIHRVTKAHGTGTDYSLHPKDRNFDTYLDPTDSRFQDSATFRALSRHRGELPEDSDKGRAVVIGHEFAHGVFKMADEHLGGRNIRDNENAIRDQLELPLRRSEGGLQFRTNE